MSEKSRNNNNNNNSDHSLTSRHTDSGRVATKNILKIRLASSPPPLQLFAISSLFACGALAMPQGGLDARYNDASSIVAQSKSGVVGGGYGKEVFPPQPYTYKYGVSDAHVGTSFDKEEAQDSYGNLVGSYR